MHNDNTMLMPCRETSSHGRGLRESCRRAHVPQADFRALRPPPRGGPLPPQSRQHARIHHERHAQVSLSFNLLLVFSIAYY